MCRHQLVVVSPEIRQLTSALNRPHPFLFSDQLDSPTYLLSSPVAGRFCTHAETKQKGKAELCLVQTIGYYCKWQSCFK